MSDKVILTDAWKALEQVVLFSPDRKLAKKANELAALLRKRANACKD